VAPLYDEHNPCSIRLPYSGLDIRRECDVDLFDVLQWQTNPPQSIQCGFSEFSYQSFSGAPSFLCFFVDEDGTFIKETNGSFVAASQAIRMITTFFRIHSGVLNKKDRIESRSKKNGRFSRLFAPQTLDKGQKNL
jgi:hypothetical protein